MKDICKCVRLTVTAMFMSRHMLSSEHSKSPKLRTPTTADMWRYMTRLFKGFNITHCLALRKECIISYYMVVLYRDI